MLPLFYYVWVAISSPGATQIHCTTWSGYGIVTGRAGSAQLRIRTEFRNRGKNELTRAVTKLLIPDRNNGDNGFLPQISFTRMNTFAVKPAFVLRLFPSHALLLLKVQSNNSCKAVIALTNVFVGF